MLRFLKCFGVFWTFCPKERALFLQCKKIVSEKREVRDWLQSLHGWVTMHRTRPHWNASNPEEKLQAERLKRAQLLLKGKRGKLNPTEEQLLLNCTRTLGLVPSPSVAIQKMPRICFQNRPEKWGNRLNASVFFSVGGANLPVTFLELADRSHDLESWLGPHCQSDSVGGPFNGPSF